MATSELEKGRRLLILGVSYLAARLCQSSAHNEILRAKETPEKTNSYVSGNEPTPIRKMAFEGKGQSPRIDYFNGKTSKFQGLDNRFFGECQAMIEIIKVVTIAIPKVGAHD